MFVKRRDFEELKETVSTLKNYAHNDFDRLKYLTKRLKKVEKELEKPRRMSDLLFTYSWNCSYGDTQEIEPEQLTLRQEVEQIKDLLNIKETTTNATRKLVIEPKKKAVSKKTASKTPAALKKMAKKGK